MAGNKFPAFCLLLPTPLTQNRQPQSFLLPKNCLLISASRVFAAAVLLMYGSFVQSCRGKYVQQERGKGVSQEGTSPPKAAANEIWCSAVHFVQFT